MNLSDLWGTLRNALGQATAKAASPAPKPAAPTPTPAPRLAAAAPVAPRPAPVSVPGSGPAASGGATAGSATLVRAVRAGGRMLAAGIVVKVVAVHGSGSAYTVQVPGLATPKTIEGAALRVG
jgi:hypothetical protein